MERIIKVVVVSALFFAMATVWECVISERQSQQLNRAIAAEGELVRQLDEASRVRTQTQQAAIDRVSDPQAHTQAAAWGRRVTRCLQAGGLSGRMDDYWFTHLNNDPPTRGAVPSELLLAAEAGCAQTLLDDVATGNPKGAAALAALALDLGYAVPADYRRVAVANASALSAIALR